MAKQPVISKPCERCRVEPAVKGERFCKACRKQVLSELQEANFLTPAGHNWGSQRTGEQKENTRETKYGTDQR